MIRSFFFCFFCVIAIRGSAQQLLIHSSQLDSLSNLDSVFWVEGFRQNGKAIGQLNSRFPATLIDESGIVLVAREAIRPYAALADTARIIFYQVPLPLKNVVLSFPLEITDITNQIMPDEQSRKSYDAQMAQVQRNIAQMRMQADTIPQIRTTVRVYHQQNRFFLHRYLDFTKIQLLAYTNYSGAPNYALLRILGESPYPPAPSIEIDDKVNQVHYCINYPPRTYYNSSSSAITLHLRSLESNLRLLAPAIEVYQSFRRLPPQKLMHYYEEQAEEQAYLIVESALEKRQARENYYLRQPQLLRLQRALKQKTNAVERMHDFFHLSQALNRSLPLISLCQFLQRQEGRSDEVMEKRLLSYLKQWENNWNASIAQKLFATLMPLYFDESQASYFSTVLIDQIRSSGKSFEILGQQIYTESILAQPQRLRSVLQQEGPTALYRILERDVGYLFFSQLLRDQQEKIFSPYRNDLREWTALEREWLKMIAEIESLPFLDGNTSQRFHWLKPGQIETLPAWEDNAGSPAFNQNHDLIGFVFPQKSAQPGLNWQIPEARHSYHYCAIEEILQMVKTLRQ